MGRVCKRPILFLSGLLVAALNATPQAYTISARPGAVNYIEGNAFRNGKVQVLPSVETCSALARPGSTLFPEGLNRNSPSYRLPMITS